jgi:hypothetical protein
MTIWFAVRHPLLLVLFRERIVVNHCLPVGLGSQIIGQSGAAQDATHMLRILPCVVDHSFSQHGNRQMVGRLIHLERRFL